MTLKEQIAKIVKNWRGTGETLDTLTIHNLIWALDQAKCDVVNDVSDSNPLIPLLIEEQLNAKLIKLISHPEEYPLKDGLGTIERIYILFRPKYPTNMNRLFVVSKTERGYNLGVDYDPENGNWGHGHYGAKTIEQWEKYISDEYGIYMPLFKKEDI